MIFISRVLRLGVLLSLALPENAFGQAPGFGDVTKQLNPGDQVVVLDRAGRSAIGRFDHLSDSEIVVKVDSLPVAVPSSDVRRISVPRHGKRNGAIIGAAFGLGAGLITMRSVDVEGPALLLVPLVSTGLYGAMGLGIGALVPSQRVIYRGPEPVAGGRPTAATAHGAGVRFTFSW